VCPAGSSRTDSLSALVGHWVHSGLPGYREGASSYYPQSTPRPSPKAGISTSAEFPHWFYPLERYISYGVHQAERAVKGIGRIESRMDEFKPVQTDIHAPIDSQTGMLHSLFDHFGIDPDA
jgi:hypothetical protein